MTAIYGFSDAKRFAVVCADNHSASDPVDKVVRVGSSLAVGVIGQPIAVDLLRDLHLSLKGGATLGSVEDFMGEFADRIRAAQNWYVPAFEEESRRRANEAWDRLMRMSPIRLGVLDLRDLSLHEMHFGWPLPPGRLRATPQFKSLAAGSIWRFGITAPREPSPDVSQLETNPAAVFERLLAEDSGEGVGTLGTLVTLDSGRLALRSATGSVEEETLVPASEVER